MPYDPNKHLASRAGVPKKIYAGVDDIDVVVRGIPWSLKNQYASQAIQWDDSGKRSFNIDEYVRSCLKFMLVEAPWGDTTDTFLSTVGEDLGTALQELVPTAFGGGNVAAEADGIKKEP